MQVTLDFDMDTAEGQQRFRRFQELFLAGAANNSSAQAVIQQAAQEGIVHERVPPVGNAMIHTPPTNRQAAAAKARAAKDAKKTVKAPELNDDAQAELHAPIEFPDAASMSPGEARDAGLALVRQAYAAGHTAPVKALQKQWAVAKFYDVPVDQGHEFYQAAMKLSQSVGLHP